MEELIKFIKENEIGVIYGSHADRMDGFAMNDRDVMRFVNYMTKEYQAKILQFREELKESLGHTHDTKKTKELQNLLNDSFKELLTTGESKIDSKDLEEFGKDFQVFSEHPLITWYDSHFGIQKLGEGEIRS